MDELVFTGCTGFEWDSGNADKNREKHEGEPGECEEAFFNRPFIVTDDERHSQDERRYLALGRSDSGRRLFLVFTIRGEFVRVISARDMSRKERAIYEKAVSGDPQA